MSARRGWRIVSRAQDLEEGLFGQGLLWVFEILPWLDAGQHAPEWDIRAKLYGAPPDHRVLPGVFEPVSAWAPGAGDARSGSVLPARAYPRVQARTQPQPQSQTQSKLQPSPRTRTLLWTRVLHLSALGGDWAGTHALWTRFFRVPARIEACADAFALPPDCLGLHYRGTDKNRATIDTNPVAVDDFLLLAEAFLARRPELRAVFVASDEPGVLAAVVQRFPAHAVHGLGDVAFHKASLPASAGSTSDKADRALLDCVLLSRCRVVLKCSSALSGFAKVLNPRLECYRVAACKLFADIPYFPDAYVPRLELAEPAAARAILARQLEGDWLDDPQARARWATPFVARPRHGPGRIALNALKYAVSVLLGRPRKA